MGTVDFNFLAKTPDVDVYNAAILDLPGNPNAFEQLLSAEDLSRMVHETTKQAKFLWA